MSSFLLDETYKIPRFAIGMPLPGKYDRSASVDYKRHWYACKMHDTLAAEAVELEESLTYALARARYAERQLREARQRITDLEAVILFNTDQDDPEAIEPEPEEPGEQFPDQTPAWPDTWAPCQAYGCLGLLALLAWLIIVLCLCLVPGGLS